MLCGRSVLYSVPLSYISPLSASDECSAVCNAQSSSPVRRAEDGSPRGELQRIKTACVRALREVIVERTDAGRLYVV